jgi:hypothetical protein
MLCVCRLTASSYTARSFCFPCYAYSVKLLAGFYLVPYAARYIVSTQVFCYVIQGSSVYYPLESTANLML